MIDTSEGDAVRGAVKGPVLVVEDEGIAADLIESMLRDFGYTLVLHASNVEEALRIIDDYVLDVVILDANLRGSPAHRVASQLKTRNVPFVVSTGFDPARLPDSFAFGVSLRKPYSKAELARSIDEARAGSGRSPQ